jgi:ankyrin repeat protein
MKSAITRIIIAVLIIASQSHLIYAAPKGTTYNPSYSNEKARILSSSVGKSVQALLQARNAEEIMALVNAGIVELNSINSETDLSLLGELMNLYNDFDLPRLLPILINAGADVNIQGKKSGMTPLFSAILSKNPELVSILLKAGAKVNVKFRMAGTEATSLALAVSTGELDIITMLLKAGADIKPDVTVNNVPSTIMQYAIMSNINNPNPAIISTLINAGADVNKTYKNGSYAAPIIMAAQINRPDLVSLLIDAKANVNVKDAKGRTALSMSTNPQIVSMLMKAGAKPLK